MLTVPKLAHQHQARRQNTIQNLPMINLRRYNDFCQELSGSDKHVDFQSITSTPQKNKQNCPMARRQLQIDTSFMSLGQSSLKINLQNNLPLLQLGQVSRNLLKKQAWQWTYQTAKKSKAGFSPKYMKQRQDNQRMLQSLKLENENYKKLLHQNQFLNRRDQINSIPQFNTQSQSKTINYLLPKIKGNPHKQNNHRARKAFEDVTNLTQSFIFDDQEPIGHFDFMSPKQALNMPCSENLSSSDFQQIKFLGKGNFGEVHLVRHNKTNFICAMKTIKKSFVKQENVVHQISRQIRIHLSLKNLNIIGFYGFFDDSQNIYLLIEYATGGQLFKKLKQCYRMPQKDVVPIIKDTIDGLKYIHSMGYIHRDLKPENVIFQFGIAKICDMGWAAQCGFNNMRKSFCGTPLYLPPQMIRKEQYDQSADIWSVGILTYELLVGKVPFNIWSQWDLQLIVDKQIKFPTDYVDLSSNSIDFMERCLTKDPSQRIKLQQLIRHPFIQQNQNKGYFNIQVYNAVESLF